MGHGLRQLLSALVALLLIGLPGPFWAHAQSAAWERDGLDGRDVRAVARGADLGSLVALTGGTRDPMPLWLRDAQGWSQPAASLPGFVLAMAPLPEGGLLLATGRDIADQPGIFLASGNPIATRRIYDGQAIGALAVVPGRAGSDVYAAAAPWADREASSEVLRRDPATGNWSSIHRGTLTCGQAASYFRQILAAGTSRLYALEWCLADGSRQTQLWRSDDRGQSWVLLPGSGSTNSLIGSVAVDPTDPDVLFRAPLSIVPGSAASSQATPGQAAQTVDLEQSNDAGQTWRALPDGVDGLSHVRGIVVDPRDAQRLLCATDRNGIFASNDRGESWHRLDGLEGVRVRSMLLDEASGRLYAATNDGVWRITLP
jgi:hypothetical protein